MRISDYVNDFRKRRGREPRIGFIGIGISNLYLLSCLPGVPAVLRNATYIDRAMLPWNALNCEMREGSGYLDGLDEDVLILSPSVRRDAPQLRQAAWRGAELISDAELFFLDNKATVYAVTGSDGKSTTATLLSMLLSERHPKISLIGNIGAPLSKADSDVCVAELSSFQLNYMRPRSCAAILTPVTPNHLDWHGCLEEYLEAKLNVFANAKKRIATPDTPLSEELIRRSGCDVLYSLKFTARQLCESFGASHTITLEGGSICTDGEPLLPAAKCKRQERHNLHNFMGALAAACGECSSEHIVSVAERFSGLEHRIEHLPSPRGCDIINSSIDTSPARTACTLSSLARPVRLILGGRGKGLPLLPTIPLIAKYAKRISLYGEVAEQYLGELQASGIDKMIECERFALFADAIEHASRALCAGDTILLSPAATGYGEFRDYAERGRYFKKYIHDKFKAQSCERT